MPEYQAEIYSRCLLVEAHSNRMSLCAGHAAIRVLSPLGRDAPASPEQEPPRDRPALSFTIIRNEADWSSFMSLRGAFPLGSQRGACLPGAPLGTHGASLSPQADVCSPLAAADGLPAVSAHCCCVHVLLPSVFNSEADLLGSLATAEQRRYPFVSSHGA